MAKRTKPNTIVAANLNQVEAYLAEMASIDRQMGGIESDMNEAIDRAKAQAAQQSEPLKARRKALSDAICTYCTLNKGEHFKDAKSLDLAFGVVGFHASTKIVQKSGISAEMSLGKLKEYKFNEAIRIKEEINKDALAAWPAERLDLIGMRRQKSDAFYIEIKAEAVNGQGV